MKFLAVDDEDIVRNVLVKTLQKAQEGCIVEQSGSPTDALRIIKEGFIPDIAFLDIEMFGMTGIELAKRIKDICHTTEIVFVTGHSQYAINTFAIHAHGYLLKPVILKQVQDEIHSITENRTERLLTVPQSKYTENRLNVTCFGNFEASVNGKPLQFPRKKAKELLAFLIDKKGSSCTTKELIAVLFEDKPYSHGLLNQVQTIISALVVTLREAGVSDAIKKEFNSIAVNTKNIDCDYYRFLSGDIDAINSYSGEYMSNYEWSEMTTGWLSRMAEKE